MAQSGTVRCGEDLCAHEDGELLRNQGRSAIRIDAGLVHLKRPTLLPGPLLTEHVAHPAHSVNQR